MFKLIFSLLVVLNCFASNSYDFAHIYASQLVLQLDREMKSENFSLLKSETYKKILASREFIEELGINPNLENEKSVLELRRKKDISQYIDTCNTIDVLSKNIIFPSVGKNGNITGNQFPADTWSLTFDDGPRGDRTKTIVDNLYSRGLEATFFMLTAEAKKYLSAAKYVQDANMEIALHSYTHKSLAKASDARLKYEVTQAKVDLEKLLNIKLSNFRLPYGAGLRNANTRKAIADNNLVHIFWNVDTLDWKDKNPESVFRRTKTLMAKSPKNSGVILFHDIQAPTVKTSELVMDYLIQEELNVCKVQDVILHSNGSKVNCIK